MENNIITKEEDVFIILNFKDKIEQKFFTKPDLFCKMVNLNTQKPYVQIGNHVFYGVYEDGYLGTNLLFNKEARTKETSIFELQSSVQLNYIGKTTKVLSLQWQKIPDEIIDVDSKELIELDFRESYETVLNKIERGVLNIDHIVKQPKPEAYVSENVEIITDDNNLDVDESSNVEEKKKDLEVKLKKVDVTEEVMDRYTLLKKMVTRDAQIPTYFNVTDADSFKTSEEFSILKGLYLKNLDYKKIKLKINEKRLENYVDVQSSIKAGIIPKKELINLTLEEKQALFSIKNFDNLSIPMKLTLLIEHLNEEKIFITGMTREELKKQDDYGRTPKDRYRLLKSLARDIQYHLFLRIKDITTDQV